MGLQNDFKPAFAQYSISIPPENIKFSEVFKECRNGALD